MSLNEKFGPFCGVEKPQGTARPMVGFSVSGLSRIAVFCVSAIAMTAVTGETVTVPAFSFVTNHVEAGAQIVQTGKMLLSPEGEMSKTGGGEWTVPLSLLPQPWSVAFNVKEGSLVLDTTSAGTCEAPSGLPEEIKAKALLWVDASDPVASHIAGEDGKVSVWYDRREGEDVSSPAYCRAVSYTGHTNEIPTSVALGGITNAVYFGGYRSGQAMEFLLPSGSRYSESSSVRSVKQVFAVHIPAESYGTLFGSFTATAPVFKMDSTRSETMENYYWESASVWPTMSNGRTYLDGERIDGTLTRVRKGLQVLEGIRFYNLSGAVHGFFAGRTPETSGGDYICEALVFTNSLTESERLVVTEYLMAKWKPETPGRRLSVEVKTCAAIKVDAGENDVDLGDFPLTGNGMLELSGGGDVLIRNGDCKVFDGTLYPGAGTVTLRSPMAVASPRAGRITVTNTVSGPELTVSAVSGDALCKDGREKAVIRSVPQTLHRVDVEEGTLSVLSPVPADVRDEYTRIPVLNGGFEDFADDIAALAGDKAVISHSPMNTAERGWSYVWNAGAAYVMNWWRWTVAGAGIETTKRSDWPFDAPPPEGECALILRGLAEDAIVRSDAFELEAGLYEIRFYMSGRQSDNYIGPVFSPRLIAGESTEVKARFGDVMYTDISGYKEFRLRTTVAESGSYRFEFRSLADRKGVVVVDDVRLFKVTPSRATLSEWKIPGGNFETNTVEVGKGIMVFSADHTLEGWTFNQSGTWSGGRADVGLTSICVTNAPGYGKGTLFNDSRRPATGSMELCFLKNGASAVTTFVPPAGRWLLQGDLAQLGSYGCNPKLSASVSTGGVVTDLGTIPARTRMMKKFAWPVSFVSDGAREVTLTLTVSGAGSASGSNEAMVYGLLVDDLVLAGVSDTDLMKDGDCESWSDVLLSHDSSVFGGKSGGVRSARPAEADYAFGSTTIQGSYMLIIGNLSALYEDVHFPFPGRYRLSFYAKSRLNDRGGGNYGPNPLKAWIASGSVTNVIGHVDTYNYEWVQRVIDFDVPSAGVWRVALQGCDDPENASHIHEAHVDAITIRQIPVAPLMTPPFPKDCSISVAEGARLEVGFSGTNTVRGLRLGNSRLNGVVDVADHPDYLSGTGTFKVVPWGTVISLR